MSKILEAGEYILEDGMTIERTGKFISVRPIVGYNNKPRCSKCKYFGHGRATRGGWTTTVCLKQPKRYTDKDGQKLYYHIGMRQLACDNFDNKQTE